jgi:hypothetical protein
VTSAEIVPAIAPERKDMVSGERGGREDVGRERLVLKISKPAQYIPECQL